MIEGKLDYSEGLDYDTSVLSQEHSRVRRSANPKDETLKFHFNAFGR